MHKSEKPAPLAIKLVKVYISLYHSLWQSFSVFFSLSLFSPFYPVLSESLGAHPHVSGLRRVSQGGLMVMSECVRTEGRGVSGIKALFFSSSSPFSFGWETRGCQGDEVGGSPTAWSGKSSSLFWHLQRAFTPDNLQRERKREWEEKEGVCTFNIRRALLPSVGRQLWAFPSSGSFPTSARSFSLSSVCLRSSFIHSFCRLAESQPSQNTALFSL